MTSKERAALRGRANSLDVLFQVGKGGISDALIEQTDGALRTRELIKLRVLTETSPIGAKEAAQEIAERTGAEVVHVIGGVMILYRYNPELHEKKKVKKPARKATWQDPKDKKFRFARKSPFEDKKGRDKRIKRKIDK